jgi:ABC-2 type transport system permease protein
MMNISRGVLDSRDVVYFLSIIVLFVFLTVRAVEGRKWR